MKIVADSLILSFVVLRLFNGRMLRRLSDSVLLALAASRLLARCSEQR